MQALYSEQIFEDYLIEEKIPFDRDYVVNGCNVDFYIKKNMQPIYCDVKEVRGKKITLMEGQEILGGAVTAQESIRNDIRKLRDKFDKPPKYPVLLVTMNFSNNFFTGLTVSRALLGEIGIIYDKNNPSNSSPLHHLHKGNAALTMHKNRSVSGVFVFDVNGNNHYLFISPYANHPIPSNYFNVQTIYLKKNENEDVIKQLSGLMFFQYEYKKGANTYKASGCQGQ
jgi:hypothetical protein